MADALCGPSNALSTFQKHTSVDRTLQQDRLVSQRPHEQGFRSAPGPNAGILDAEFEAFQANSPPLQLHEGHQQLGFPAALPGRGFQSPQPQLGGWASDFQNMSLQDLRPSSASSSHFQQFAPPRPGASSATWHQEFLRESAFGQRDSPSQTSQQPFFGNTNPYSMAQYPSSQYHPMQENVFVQPPGKPLQQEPDDALFEKHFAAAALEAETAMQKAEPQTTSVGAETLATTQRDQVALDASTLPSMQPPAPQEPIIDASVHDPIGSDRISNDRGKSTEEHAPDDADELARTAGTLLENVKHDQSQKFKQSNFLSLMRRLRDREVRVEGEKFVDATQPLHPGGDFYPTQLQDESELDHSGVWDYPDVHASPYPSMLRDHPEVHASP